MRKFTGRNTYFELAGVWAPELGCMGGMPLAGTSGFEWEIISCDAMSPACRCFCELFTVVVIDGELTGIPVTDGRLVTVFVTTVTVVVTGCDTDQLTLVFVSVSVLTVSCVVTGTGGVCFLMKWSGSGNLRFGLSSPLS